MTLIENRLATLVLAVSFALSASAAWGQSSICPEDYRKAVNSGIYAIEAGAGPKPYSGLTYTVGGSYWFKNKPKTGVRSKRLSRGFPFPTKFIKANIFYTEDRKYFVKQYSTGIDLLVGYTPFNIRNRFYPSLLLGGTYAINSTNIKTPLFFENRQLDLNINRAGIVLGGEMTMFLSPTSNNAIALSVTQRIFDFQNLPSWGDNRVYFLITFRHYFTQMRILNAKGR